MTVLGLLIFKFLKVIKFVEETCRFVATKFCTITYDKFFKSIYKGNWIDKRSVLVMMLLIKQTIVAEVVDPIV